MFHDPAPSVAQRPASAPGTAPTGTAAPQPTQTAARPTNVIPTRRVRYDPRLANGQYVFMQHCNQCHVGGEAGLGPSLIDKPFLDWLVRIQVRTGFGAMPRFPKHIINDAQLEDVTRYLHYLHDHPEGPRRS